MIKKYNEYTNEKLTDKLQGFDKDELFKQFLDNKLTAEKLLDNCEKYNIEIPDDFEKKLKDKLNNNEILLESYLRICKFHNLKTLSKDELLNIYKSGKINFDKYLTLCNKYNIDISIDDVYEKVKNMNNYIDDMLEYSCRFNFTDLFKLAIKNGANLNYRKQFTLLNSVKNNNYEMVKTLVDNNSDDINMFDSEPLLIAVQNGNFEIIKYLFEHGAKITNEIMNLQLTDEIKELLKKYYKQCLEHIKIF